MKNPNAAKRKTKKTIGRLKKDIKKLDQFLEFMDQIQTQQNIREIKKKLASKKN